MPKNKIRKISSQAKLPDENGYFGPFGGRFIPETLWAPLTELETGFKQATAWAQPLMVLKLTV
jgi:tryptophan synthase beta subunit